VGKNWGWNPGKKGARNTESGKMWWEAGKIGKRKAGEIGKIFTTLHSISKTQKPTKMWESGFYSVL